MHLTENKSTLYKCSLSYFMQNFRVQNKCWIRCQHADKYCGWNILTKTKTQLPKVFTKSMQQHLDLSILVWKVFLQKHIWDILTEAEGDSFKLWVAERDDVRLVPVLLQTERLPQLPRARCLGGGGGGADLALAAPLQPQRVCARPGYCCKTIHRFRNHGEGHYYGRAAIRHYANQPACPLWLLRRQPIFMSTYHGVNISLACIVS